MGNERAGTVLRAPGAKSPACIDCRTRRGANQGERIRGLCRACYTRGLRRGQIEPRPHHRGANVVEDLEWLGFDPRLPIAPQLRRFAPRLGMTTGALAKAWQRHSARVKEVA
jgi:transglutaminase-like putative cysteine protease